MVLVLFHILKTERDDGYGQKTDGIMAAVHTDRAGQRLSAVPRKHQTRAGEWTQTHREQLEI